MSEKTLEERSLRPEGVGRGSDYWEGRLVLPSDRERRLESLYLTVTWGALCSSNHGRDGEIRTRDLHVPNVAP